MTLLQVVAMYVISTSPCLKKYRSNAGFYSKNTKTLASTEKRTGNVMLW